MQMIRSLFSGLMLWILLLSGVVELVTAGDRPPDPYGPVPSERQLRWHEMEFYGFIHFTVNTFTDKEWGYGDESPSIFQPTALDAGQWARTARQAGMKGLILTAKHHDGFCLWPSRFTEHSVKNSPWRDGKGDVVKELSEACRREGLRFGVYLSPWDRNHPDYGKPEYIVYYRNQLQELLTRYGDLFEVWFDGANGGDGYYGGAREKRLIDRKTYYDWPRTWEIVRRLQPMACMFSDGGPDIRWVGNERGIAGETSWATLNRADFAPGVVSDVKWLTQGQRPATDWLPAECDVSIRPGWFYHAKEDDKVKTPEKLTDLYFQSVGHGGSFLLNLPPDRRGLIHENDVASLVKFREILDSTFRKNLMAGARIQADSIRGGNRRYAPGNLLDDRRDTYWCPKDGSSLPEIVLEKKRPITFDVIRLREYLPLGQRIETFALDTWEKGQWREFATGTSIGNCRLWRGEPITTTKVRLRITKAAAVPALSEFSIFRMDKTK